MYGTLDFGYEYTFRAAWDDSVPPATQAIVTLYDDSVSKVKDDDDFAAITNTEPSGASYSRQTPAMSSFAVEFSGGRWSSLVDGVTFDVSDSTVQIASWAIGIEFQSASDSSPTPHLCATGALGAVVDLSQLTGTYTLNGAGPRQRDV